MLEGKKVIVVMPAYNAAVTLEQTYNDMPRDLVDEVLVVDDHSPDNTVEVARKLGLPVIVHDENLGYGGNQKTCYREALARGADIVIMLHPDYQYPPKLINAMAGMVSSGMFDVVLGSRILGGTARKGGMPLYKYIANRILTFVENIFLGQKLSEYHTGYRAFSREVLTTLPLLENSNDFVFDNEMLAQVVFFDFRIGEITSPARYAKDSSSISFRRSVVYGFGVLGTMMKFVMQRMGLARVAIFDPDGKKLPVPTPAA